MTVIFWRRPQNDSEVRHVEYLSAVAHRYQCVYSHSQQCEADFPLVAFL